MSRGDDVVINTVPISIKNTSITATTLFLLAQAQAHLIYLFIIIYQSFYYYLLLIS